jgi:hydroxyethylthiazole kinase
VTDGDRVIGIDNGVPMMAKITATGCSLTAIMAAFVAVAANDSLDSTMLAAAYACAVFG